MDVNRSLTNFTLSPSRQTGPGTLVLRHEFQPTGVYLDSATSLGPGISEGSVTSAALSVVVRSSRRGRRQLGPYFRGDRERPLVDLP